MGMEEGRMEKVREAFDQDGRGRRTYVSLLKIKAEFFEPKPTQLQMACSI
jgi:hypothetical protein